MQLLDWHAWWSIWSISQNPLCTINQKNDMVFNPFPCCSGASYQCWDGFSWTRSCWVLPANKRMININDWFLGVNAWLLDVAVSRLTMIVVFILGTFKLLIYCMARFFTLGPTLQWCYWRGGRSWFDTDCCKHDWNTPTSHRNCRDWGSCWIPQRSCWNACVEESWSE